MSVFHHTTENVHLDCAEWPEPARRAWLEAFDPDDECWQADLVDRGLSPWSRPTQYDRARVYTRYLRFVRGVGRSDEIQADSVRAWIDHLQNQDLSLYTISAHVRFLCATARLLCPGQDWDWLASTRDAIAERVKAVDPAKRKDHQIFSTRELLRAGVERYVAGVNALPTPPASDHLPDWTTAQAIRNGLWLILGAVCPERVGALQQVRLGEVDASTCQLMVPSDRTKTQAQSDRVFPRDVGAALEVYLVKVRRPLVLAYSWQSGRAPHDHLWISKGGKPARPGTMAAAMKTATAELLGYSVSPHRLRDASATYIVENMPERAALASVVLQHKHSATTSKYIRQAEQIRAFQRLQHHVDHKTRSFVN